MPLRKRDRCKFAIPKKIIADGRGSKVSVEASTRIQFACSAPRSGKTSKQKGRSQAMGRLLMRQAAPRLSIAEGRSAIRGPSYRMTAAKVGWTGPDFVGRRKIFAASFNPLAHQTVGRRCTNPAGLATRLDCPGSTGSGRSSPGSTGPAARPWRWRRTSSTPSGLASPSSPMTTSSFASSTTGPSAQRAPRPSLRGR